MLGIQPTGNYLIYGLWKDNAIETAILPCDLFLVYEMGMIIDKEGKKRSNTRIE